jgi:hypothetical protein
MALIEQALEVLLEPVKIFCGLFQGVHGATIDGAANSVKR